MRNPRKTVPLLLASSVLLAIASASAVAAADQLGTAGRVTRLSINTQGSDKYASFHGSVTVRSGSNSQDYFWGGTTCPAQSLSEAQLEMLSDALNNRSRTSIKPRYRGGEAGNTRCLVAFDLLSTGS